MHRLVLLAMCLGCGDPKPAVNDEGDAGSRGPVAPADAGTSLGGEGTCVGLWTIAQGATLRSDCPPVTGLDRTLIVDIDGGNYRARRSTGAPLEVRRASAPGEPCALTLRDFWSVWRDDASYQVSWEITAAGARGIYQDLDAWNACELELAAGVTRRDLRPADVAFDARRAAAEFTSYWRTSCAPAYAKLPGGTGPAPAELRLDASGGVTGLVVGGADIWFQCTPYRCECPELVNASGAPQSVEVVLERR